MSDEVGHRAERTARVVFVGTGPGDPDLLTRAAMRAIGDADVVVADSQRLVELARAAGLLNDDGQVVVTFDDYGGRDSMPLDDRVDLLHQSAVRGRSVIRLVPGDPFVDGRVEDEARACATAGLPFEVIPGVSLLTAVPTYAGVTLGGDAGVQFVSIPGGSLHHVRPDVYSFAGTMVLNTHAGEAPGITEAALEAGRPPHEPVMVTFRGGSTRQSSTATTLGGLSHAVRDVAPDVPMLVVMGGAASSFDEGLSWFESKPLFGWRVVVPRTKDALAPMTARLRGYGARYEEVATISVERPRTPQQLDKAVRGLVEGRFSWVVFTSPNAVRAVREKFEEYGLDARAFSGLRVAAAGDIIADVLRGWGIEPDLVPTTDQSAAGVAAEFPPYDPMAYPINRVFVPRADIATESLASALTTLGWEVEDVTAFRTVRAAPPPAPIREAIKGGDFDAVLFTSSSTVRNFVGIAGKPHASTVVAVIGPATAKTCQEHGLRVDVMAVSPSYTDLADALATFAAKRRQDLVAAGKPVTRPSQRRRRRTS